MARNVDCYCEECKVYREVICSPDENPLCPTCATPMQQQWWTRRRSERTQWAEKDAVVVFRKPDGSYSYPAINTKPTPDGCERIVMRSLREVEQFEKKAGVRNEAMWYDRNGRGAEDDLDCSWQRQ